MYGSITFYMCDDERYRSFSYSPILYPIFYFLTDLKNEEKSEISKTLTSSIAVILVNDDLARFIGCYLIILPVILNEINELKSFKELDNIEKVTGSEIEELKRVKCGGFASISTALKYSTIGLNNKERKRISRFLLKYSENKTLNDPLIFN